jgi:HPt (histidine-containing phosphotransfer) domain-containing protein
VSAYLDPDRIAQLEEILGSKAGPMVSSMLASLTAAIARLQDSVAAGELEPAIQAAHAARNDALMLGAGRLQAALSDLELAARDADSSRAEAALARVDEVWPPTREELAGGFRSR